MPVLRNVRRSRRLSRQSPRDPEYEDLEQFQDLYLENLPSPGPSFNGIPVAPSLTTSSHTPSPPPPPSAYVSPPASPSSVYDAPYPAARSSHSRKKKVGHIPRPPNAFMLFRSDLWAKEKTKSTVERDHRQISRIAGHCWNNLTEKERAPFKRLAEEHKRHHAEIYPEYKYSPIYRKEKKVKRKGKWSVEDERRRCKTLTNMSARGLDGVELEKAVKMEDEEETLLFPDHSSSSSRTRSNIPIHPSPLKPIKREQHSTPELTFPTPPPSLPAEEEFVPTSEVPYLNLYDSDGATIFHKKEELEPMFVPPEYDPYYVSSMFSHSDEQPLTPDGPMLPMPLDTDISSPSPQSYLDGPDAFFSSPRPVNSPVMFTNPFSFQHETLTPEQDSLLYHDATTCYIVGSSLEKSLSDAEFGQWVQFDTD